MATIPPAIFLGVAAFLLNVVINRLVRSQRVEIAMLKSFGYDDREVAWHYLGFALVITVLGLLIGVALGALMGRGMTSMYVQFFHFPELHFQLNPWVLGMATLASLGAGIFAALGAVRKAASLPRLKRCGRKPRRPTGQLWWNVSDWEVCFRRRR
ncbi:MAG: ABC transporter permease [Verrucomicrobiales bacterium]